MSFLNRILGRNQLSADGKDVVYICGLYKSGTSWLLQALSRYSGAIGLREIDIIKLSHNSRFPHKLLSREDIIKNFLGKNAWCMVPGDQLEQVHQSLKGKSAQEYYEALMKFRPKARQPLQAGHYSASDLSVPLTFFDLPAEQAINLIKKLIKIKSGKQIIDIFKSTYDELIQSPYKLVFKGADQIVMLDVLKKVCPGEKRIVVIRDGRDAAISAFHYRKLQLERKAPWAGDIKDPLQFLQDWKGRAKLVLKAAQDNDIAVVRYEDLLENFGDQFSKILTWLGWDYTSSEVNEIREACSFENLTGRKRGESAKDVRRKGVYGEWLDFFSDEEKDMAWESAGNLLEQFGYTKDGKINHVFPGKIG